MYKDKTTWQRELCDAQEILASAIKTMTPQELNKEYMSKGTGILQVFMKGLKDISPEDRPEYGKMVIQMVQDIRRIK